MSISSAWRLVWGTGETLPFLTALVPKILRPWSCAPTGTGALSSLLPPHTPVLPPSHQDVATMQFCANKLDKKDFFGKSDPFLVFYRSNEDGT